MICDGVGSRFAETLALSVIPGGDAARHKIGFHCRSSLIAVLRSLLFFAHCWGDSAREKVSETGTDVDVGCICGMLSNSTFCPCKYGINDERKNRDANW